jgi:cathepsin D
LIPFQDALTIHLLIPGAETNGEHFFVPCGTTSKIHFTFSNVTYSIPPKDYVGEAIFGRGDFCITLIKGVQIFDEDTWLVGDVFLKNVYSVFDVDNVRVGFATRRQPTNKPDTAPAPTGTVVVQGSMSMTSISEYASSIDATTRTFQPTTASTSLTAVASNTAADAGSSNDNGGSNAIGLRSVLWSWAGALLLSWMLLWAVR